MAWVCVCMGRALGEPMGKRPYGNGAYASPYIEAFHIGHVTKSPLHDSPVYYDLSVHGAIWRWGKRRSEKRPNVKVNFAKRLARRRAAHGP